MRRILMTLVLIGLIVGSAHSAPQGPELGALMRDKLGHTQKILEAVVTSNWFELEAQSRALEELTRDPRWTVFKYPEYAKHSAAFVRAVQALRSAAAQRDLDKAPKAYITVTLQCVECHRYVARARVAD
jgi:cytochrome c556